MGRSRESGYKSQMIILLALRDFGPLHGQRIIERTGLHREELWRNLKVLVQKNIIEGEKVGRRKYYSPIVSPQALDYIIYIFYEGGVWKFKKKLRKLSRKMVKIIEQLIMHAKDAERYENEIIELAYYEHTEPYLENLPYAESWKYTKKEKLKVGYKNSVRVPTNKKAEIRETVSHPTKLQTKIVKLPSGGCFKIRKPTSLELLDIVRKTQKQDTQIHETDPYLKEAIERLTS